MTIHRVATALLRVVPILAVLAAPASPLAAPLKEVLLACDGLNTTVAGSWVVKLVPRGLACTVPAICSQGSATTVGISAADLCFNIWAEFNLLGPPCPPAFDVDAVGTTGIKIVAIGEANAFDVCAAGNDLTFVKIVADAGYSQSGLIGGTLRIKGISKGKGIPTLSEWGVIAMTLLLLSAGTIVWSRRPAMATAAGDRGAVTSGSPLFAAGVYARVLAATLGLALFGLGLARWFGPLAAVDVAGALVCAPLAAYLVHLWVVLWRNRE
ncbi:MAG TPA: IPTL-CTERM sorting domain-containing protein [Myxococcota bacterium]|jgi:hypothetical protein